MGNKESEHSKEIEIEINHPRFSKSKIIARQNEKLLQTSQAIDQKEYEKWKQALKKYKDLIPENLLLPNSHSFSRAGLCGNTGTLVINYPNYPYLLAEEIYHRKGLKGKFIETELWFLLHSLIEARKQASAAGEKLGDIRPKNIFLNEDGKIKVSNSQAWPSEISNIQKSFDKTLTYLSPEDLARLERGQAFDTPSDASEAFSIGLSILSAANLTQYEDLYDLQAFSFNPNGFNEALGLLAKNSSYSEVLRGTILLLLNLHPEKRLTCAELNELLSKHAELISKKQNFVIDNAPGKLHEEIQHLRMILAQNVQAIGVPSALVASQYTLDLKKGEVLTEQQ